MNLVFLGGSLVGWRQDNGNRSNQESKFEGQQKRKIARPSGGAGRGRKLIGRNRVNLIVGWCGQFFFSVVLRPFLGRFRGQGKFWLGKKFKDRFFIG